MAFDNNTCYALLPLLVDATPSQSGRRAIDRPGRRPLAGALFDRIEVLGIREATVHLSAHAVRHGLAAALPGQLGILVSGRGGRAWPFATRQVRGCRVTLGGHQGPVDLFLTA